jgi:hypothetical protein
MPFAGGDKINVLTPYGNVTSDPDMACDSGESMLEA